MSADGRFDETATDEAPLSEVSESEINALLDDVLRSAKFDLTSPSEDADSPRLERFHARALSVPRSDSEAEASAASINVPLEERDEWWFELDGARLGPISIRKLRFLWEDGALTPDSLCWHEGFPTWVALFRVSELADALAPKLPKVSKPVDVEALLPEAPADSGIEWRPLVGPALESSNRERLAATQQPPPAPSPQPPVSAPPEEVAGVFQTLRPPAAEPLAVESAEAPRHRSGIAGSVLGGLVAGTVVAAALLGARVYWPETPAQPSVVVIREPVPAAPAPAAPPAAPVETKQVEPRKAEPTPAEPKRPEPKRTEPTRAVPKREAKPATAEAVTASSEPKKEPVPVAVPATDTATASSTSSVDDAFAQEFAPRPDELETSEVFEVVGSNKAAIESCVQAQKAADPDTSGRLVMRWNVSLDGRVSDVSVRSKEFADLPLVGCLQKEVRTWTFPKHEVEHAPVEFPFPF